MTFTFKNRFPTQASPRNTYIGDAQDMSLGTLIASNTLWSNCLCSLSSTPCACKRFLICPLWFRKNLSSLSVAAAVLRLSQRLLGQGIIERLESKCLNQMFESKWIQSACLKHKTCDVNMLWLQSQKQHSSPSRRSTPHIANNGNYSCHHGRRSKHN